MLNTNERSLAIDIISRINSWSETKNNEIKYAGGESTLKTEKKSVLFPDVILFSDKLKTEVLHGWELKLPDTSIDDIELLENAHKKAKLFGVNSFLVWNISIAKLYKIDNDKRVCIKEWNDLEDVKKREEIKEHQVFLMLEKILEDLNNYFLNGTLVRGKIIDSISNESFIDLLFKNSESLIKSLKDGSRKDSNFDDEFNLWWTSEKNNYGKKADKWIELSKNVVISLINKIIFVNILKKYRKEARIIDKLNTIQSSAEGLKIFKEISNKCDFYNIFEEKMGEKYIDTVSWKLLVDFNDFLVQIDIANYESSLLEELLAKVVTRSKRRIAGQFSTPKELAYLLVGLALENKEGYTIDPCCGTGTIARAVYELKKFYSIKESEAIKQVWASDKFRYPLQMAMLALSTPENIGEKINIFKHDVFELLEGKEIILHNPENGEEIKEQLPKFDTIVTNLPFVQQEDFKKLNSNAVSEIEKNLYEKYSENIKIDGKSDLYAYIPFVVMDILKDNGILGVIVSNSWLGTKWGDTFFELLSKYYKVKYVINSGNGRWFDNADVVTSIIICEKYGEMEETRNTNTTFVVLKEKLSELLLDDNKNVEYEKLQEIVASIRKNRNSNYVVQNKYSLNEIEEIEKLGIVKNSLFTDCRWILEIKDKLCVANKYFEIARGERRGWDKLFYPDEKHGIEEEYIQPVLMNSKESDYLAREFSEAFCCEKSFEELETLSHFGAINWIKKFENQKNGTGKLLPEVLAKKNMQWYEMSSSAVADIALSMNPDERLFFMRLEERGFVNQRLIRFTLKDENEDIILLSALLNSILGIFYIEALGFGRGLEALDIRAKKYKEKFYILEPDLLDTEQKNKIKELYNLLEKREVLGIIDELEKDDRISLDKEILNAFGLIEYYPKIKKSLIEIYNIRKSVSK